MPVDRAPEYNQTVFSTGFSSITFGFKASYIALTNLGVGSIYPSFTGTTNATTGSYPLTSGSTLQIPGLLTAAMSFSATSTAGTVGILALG